MTVFDDILLDLDSLSSFSLSCWVDGIGAGGPLFCYDVFFIINIDFHLLGLPILSPRVRGNVRLYNVKIIFIH